ncbi:putative yffA [Escherichia coli P0299917.7]|nr:putative yffA [Escherichia coli P0299917.7]
MFTTLFVTDGEKRASRQVQSGGDAGKSVALAGSEMKRLYAVGSETGATVSFVRENAKQWTLCYRRWTGSTCHEYQHRNPRNSAQLQSRD